MDKIVVLHTLRSNLEQVIMQLIKILSSLKHMKCPILLYTHYNYNWCQKKLLTISS